MAIELDKLVVGRLVELLSPLTGLADTDGLEDLLDAVGWDPQQIGFTDPNTFSALVGPLKTALDTANQLLNQQNLELPDIAESLASLGLAVTNAVQAISSLTTAAGTPSDALTHLVNDLLGFLVAHELIGRFPRIAVLGQLAGFLRAVNVPQVTSSSGGVLRRSMRQETFDFAAVAKALKDPLNYLRSTFFVDSSGNTRAADAIADLICPDLAAALNWVGLAASYGMTPPDGGLNLSPEESQAVSRVLLVDVSLPAGAAESSLRIAIGLTDNTSAAGLGLLVVVSGDVSLVVPTENGTLSITFSGALEPLLITASSITLAFGSTGAVSLTAELKYVTTSQQQPAVRFGTSGTRLEVGKIDVDFKIASNGKVVDVGGSVDLTGVLLAIGGSNADGFLRSVLPAEPIEIQGDVGIDASLRGGIRVRGAGTLDWRAGIDKSIGPLEISEVQASVRWADGSLALRLTAALSLALGPLQVSIDGIGVAAKLAPPNQGGQAGNAGPLDVGVGFSWPTGLGISIDAGAVSGGGFVSFDQDKGEYAGFLDISIVDIIQVKFICILDTKLPDGSKGFSLLFIIFMELPPIQLGFGFTLNGVGGIAGVHRTMSPSGLQTGIHNHTLDYIINPPHTIADAPKAITAINSFFPAAQGRYLFGPILELGWETFIEVTVGVILEVPDPIKLAILGILDLALPTIEEPEEALVKIHIDVLGIIDFGAMKLSIDGSMYDSSLLEFPLLGDFALRSSWGTNPSSAFSLGGFNPNFNATGLDMPQLHRLSITISDGDNPVISANAYLALTSNTRQFGANIEAYVRAGSFSVHGYLGFDLLVTVQRHAISFEFDFAAILDVSYKGHSLAGINVTGQLTGPTPWHIHGDASFHILCFSVSKSVDHTWGQNILATIVAMAILPDLLPPFLDPQNWNALLPGGATQAVTLSAPAANKSAIIVHPMGALTVREKVVPLDLTIDQYKNGTPADGNHFSMGDVLINGSKVSKGAHHQDFFAAGEFLNLTDADKLSRSSFELYHAGLHISSDNVASGANASRTVEYQELYVEDPVLPPRPPVTYTMPADVFEALSRQSAGFSSRLKNTGLSKYKTGPSTPAATTSGPTYVVASADDLSVRTDIIGTGGASYYQARDALNSHLAKNPQDAGKLQILPAHEVAP